MTSATRGLPTDKRATAAGNLSRTDLPNVTSRLETGSARGAPAGTGGAAVMAVAASDAVPPVSARKAQRVAAKNDGARGRAGTAARKKWTWMARPKVRYRRGQMKGRFIFVTAFNRAPFPPVLLQFFECRG